MGLGRKMALRFKTSSISYLLEPGYRDEVDNKMYEGQQKDYNGKSEIDSDGEEI